MFSTFSYCSPHELQVPGDLLLTPSSEPHDLYRAYVEYMEEAGKAILEIETNPTCREWFKVVHKIDTREDFEAKLNGIKNPECRERLEEMLQQGFSHKASPDEEERWGKLLETHFG